MNSWEKVTWRKLKNDFPKMCTTPEVFYHVNRHSGTQWFMIPGRINFFLKLCDSISILSWFLVCYFRKKILNHLLIYFKLVGIVKMEYIRRNRRKRTVWLTVINSAILQAWNQQHTPEFMQLFISWWTGTAEGPVPLTPRLSVCFLFYQLLLRLLRVVCRSPVSGFVFTLTSRLCLTFPVFLT